MPFPLLEGWRRRGIKNSIPTSQTAKNILDFFGPFHQKDPSEDWIHHFFPDSPKVTWTCWLLTELWFTRRHACLTSLPSAQLSVKPLHGLIRFKSCSRWKRWLFNPVRWRVLVQNRRCFKAAGCKRGLGCTPFLEGNASENWVMEPSKISDGNGTSFLKQLSIFLASTVVLEGWGQLLGKVARL